MDATGLSLLPPLIVVCLIVATRRLNVSLALGIVAAALIAAHGNCLVACTMCIDKIITHFSDLDNIFLYALLIIISSLIVLLTVTGSAAGCAQIIGKKMRTKRSVEMSSILLAFLLSIDDYLSILTVGFVMRPIADRLAVARTKLAYIVHALAGPLVIIMPISTWAAAVLAQFDNAGIGAHSTSKIIADPFYVYMQTLPFIFYSVLLVLSVVFVVQRRISFGAIYCDEQSAVAIHNEIDEMRENKHHSLIELLLPIGLLVVGVFVGILYSGDCFIFGGTHSFIEAFKNNNQTFLVFFVSSLLALFVSVCISLCKRMIVVIQLPAVVYEGFLLIKSSIIMVVLASILGSFLRLDLHTGSYVAKMLLGSVSLSVVPVMVFVVSLLITLATGSAWGTFSLLIPITVEMVMVLFYAPSPVRIEDIQLLFPTLGALLSGAACGNHIAPFAETTIMTATSTGIQPLEHARTQFAYAVPVIIGACISFLIAGLMGNYDIWVNCAASLSVGLIVSIGLLSVGDVMWKNSCK